MDTPPKNKNTVIISQIVANLCEFLSSAEHKGRYFEERLQPNSCLAPLTSEKRNPIEVNGGKVPNVLQNVFLVFSRRKKLIQVCDNLRPSK